jgi:hypothetical protein
MSAAQGHTYVVRVDVFTPGPGRRLKACHVFTCAEQTKQRARVLCQVTGFYSTRVSVTRDDGARVVVPTDAGGRCAHGEVTITLKSCSENGYEIRFECRSFEALFQFLLTRDLRCAETV